MNKSKLNSLTEEQLHQLSNSELCSRMETVLDTILCESYTDPRAINCFPRQNIKDFYNSEKIQSLNNTHQRTALEKCFEYLVLIDEYPSRISGWLNENILNNEKNEDELWLSPRFQSIQCASEHFKITSSSATLERMIDLLHIIDNGHRIKQKNKFNYFSNWLLHPKNMFIFFAPNLPYFKDFKSKQRTAEVHKESPLPKRSLMLQKPSFEDINAPLKLYNILLSMWNPLLDLLNFRIPLTTGGSGAGLKWLNAITNKETEKIHKEIDSLKARLKIDKDNKIKTRKRGIKLYEHTALI